MKLSHTTQPKPMPIPVLFEFMKRLFKDTVSAFKNYSIDTVSAYETYVIDTTSAYKNYVIDTVAAYICHSYTCFQIKTN